MGRLGHLIYIRVSTVLSVLITPNKLKVSYKSALYKANRTLRTVRTLLFYIGIKRPNHDILFRNI